MEFKLYHPSEQIDPAVDLGVIPPPLPEIQFLRDFVSNVPSPPLQVIEGLLHLGSKMIIGGTSKSNKSWSLLDLSVSVSSGQPWWGRRCTKMPVVYINFELHPWAIAQRLNAIVTARPECKGFADNLALWNLRGWSADLTLLRPQLELQLARHEFGLIIIDPVYKVLGNRDENANGDVAGLMNEFEGLGRSAGASLAMAHHFAKGDSTSKNAIDRMSGAGAWARDPDTILVLTPHEEVDCFTASTILRNLPPVDEFVMRWDYPLMKLATHLNPDALRRPQAKNKVCTDAEFVEQLITKAPISRGAIVKMAGEIRISPATIDRYLKRLSEAKVIGSGGGLYWRLDS